MTNKQKQWQLQYLGYYGGNIDGIIGPQTEAATKAFQKDNCLQVDGIFGPFTEAFTTKIIKALQEALGVRVDGLAGPETVAATKAYQAANGLVADGIAGPLTRAALAQEGDWWDSIKHFKREEFACKCGGKYCNGYPADINRRLVTVADRIREHYESPVTVSSGLRCEKHNEAVGGVAGSRHKLGKAMDFCVKGRSASSVLEYVWKQPEIRYAYAIDSNYVHMDVS